MEVTRTFSLVALLAASASLAVDSVREEAKGPFSDFKTGQKLKLSADYYPEVEAETPDFSLEDPLAVKLGLRLSAQTFDALDEIVPGFELQDPMASAPRLVLKNEF